jgi:hypothetical protein
MNELEFQRPLSPDQIREALSLLDSTGNAKLDPLDPDPRPASSQAAEIDPGADQVSTANTAQSQLPVPEEPQRRKQYLNLLVAFYYGLGIAAAAALTLLSWSDRALAPPAISTVDGEPLANQQPAQLVKGAFPTRPLKDPTSDQGSNESERRQLNPATATASPVNQANRADDQAAAKDAINRASVTPDAAEKATTAANRAWWGERANRKPKEVWARASADRVATAKKRLRRSHWRSFAEMNGGACFRAACLTWQKQHAFYEPPRTVNQ